MKKEALYFSKIGGIKICYLENTVLGIELINHKDWFKEKEFSTFSDEVFKQLQEYLDGKRMVFEFSYETKGTKFQEKVWESLRKIPYGETRTYKDIAISIGNPKASRAVGMANNKNPIPIIIPCHRVIGSNGKLVGYAGGMKIKEELLEIEKK